MRLMVTLQVEEQHALWKLAERERRDMRDQAAMLLHEALENRGYLPADPQSADLAQREADISLTQIDPCSAVSHLHLKITGGNEHGSPGHTEMVIYDVSGLGGPLPIAIISVAL